MVPASQISFFLGNIRNFLQAAAVFEYVFSVDFAVHSKGNLYQIGSIGASDKHYA